MQQITIVIPCYNEAQRLPIQEYRRFLFSNPSINLVLVNDGSTDNTFIILDQLRSEFSTQILLLNLNRNVGKAEAVRRGMLLIDKFQKRDIIGFMDADLSTPFEEIEYFINEFRNPRIQFVFGSRFSRIGARIIRFQRRHYFGRFVATLVSLYLRIPIYDSQCGAKFFHIGFARRMFLEPFVSKWLFDVELFKRISILGLHAEDCSLELPLHTWIEKGGSKITFGDYWKLPIEFLKIITHYANSHPEQQKQASTVSRLIALTPSTRTVFP